jgi:hypothetical protein
MTRAAKSTFDALMYSLRGGTKVLTRSDVLGRLSELDDKQLREAIMRLQKFEPDIAAAWTREELQMLIHKKKG